MDDEMSKLVDDCEASWPTTKELAFVIDDPLEKLMEKATKIFKGRHWDNLDTLAVRIADAIPEGANEQNFEVAEPIAGAASKHFSNIERLRTGLNRPFLDAKKAVDGAAKATAERAEPLLRPIINAVKAIKDRRKREEEAKEAARLKKIEDDRLAAEKAHRDMIEAEHAREKKRLADEAAANRRQADELAEKNRAANDELAELKRQLEKYSVAKTLPEADSLGEAIVSKLDNMTARPPIDLTPLDPFDPKPEPPPVVKALEKTLGAKMCQMDDHGYPILPPSNKPGDEARFSVVQDPTKYDYDPNKWPMETDAPQVFPNKFTDGELVTASKIGGDLTTPLPPSNKPGELNDAFKIDAYADAIAAIRPPVCVDPQAKIAVELAAFDLLEVSKRLQEWKGA